MKRSGLIRLMAAAVSLCMLGRPYVLRADEEKKADTEFVSVFSAEELKEIRDQINQGDTEINIRLTADIVLNPGTFEETGSYVSQAGEQAEKWVPIGTDAHPYAGIFDGNGYSVSGVYVSSSDSDQGFFGETDSAEIRNLTVRNSLIEGNGNTGGIAGHAVSSLIENCRNEAFIASSNNMNGGIAGCVESSTITSCINTGDLIHGEFQNGGICGHAENSEISFCVNSGNLTVKDHAGGIAAYNVSGVIRNCINKGNVSTTNSFYTYTAGIAANNLNPDSLIEDCLNLGSISGSEKNGSIVSAIVCANDDNGSWAENCYSIPTGNYGFGLSAGSFADEDDLSSGRITYLLKDGFGQMIGTDPYPVFQNETNSVYRLKYDENGLQGIGNIEDVYANSGTVISLYQPAEAGMRWMVDGKTVASVIMDHSDVTVKAEAIAPEVNTGQENTYQFVTGDSVSIRLADYIVNPEETGSCTYSLKDGSALPAGLELGSDGVISGTVKESGSDAITFLVRNYYGAENEIRLIMDTEDPHYTIVIPSSVSLGDSLNISADNVLLNSGKKLLISVSDGFSVQDETGDQLRYSILQNDRSVQLHDAVLEVQSGASGKTTLQLEKPQETPKYAGKYTGKLVFEITTGDTEK